MADPARPPHLFLDANAILRYLRDDVPVQANAVRLRLIQAQAGRLVLEIHPLILAEVLFVLQSFYAVPRQKIAAVLTTFLDTPGIKMHEERRVREAFTRYLKNKVSFIDAYLAVLGAEFSWEILSFDKGLDKFRDIRRIEK
jgi:predicted nucleic-acid-binding protein